MTCSAKLKKKGERNERCESTVRRQLIAVTRTQLCGGMYLGCVCVFLDVYVC